MATTNQIAQQQAEIAARKQKEEARHNMQGEYLQREANINTRRGQDIGARTERFKSIVGGFSNLGSAGIKTMGNDPSWYNKDPQLVKDVASLPFGIPLGVPLDFVGGIQQSIPGVMVLDFVPTLGADPSGTFRTMNVAARNLYAYVRHANSGARNYEATDLMMYVLSVISANVVLAHAELVYSLALTAKSSNRYYPRGMLAALGYNPDDVIGNLAQLRASINTFIEQINSFPIPGSMPMVARQIWMASTIWKDAEVKKSQEFLFNPVVYYTWNDTPNTNLVPRQFTRSVAGIQTALNSIISGLLTDEDIGIISGDILKAYPENELLRATSIPEDFHVEAVFSMEVLSQITNATIWGINTLDDFAIQQEGLSIYQGSEYGAPSISVAVINNALTSGGEMGNIGERFLFNMYKDAPTPDDAMVASRLITTVSEWNRGEGTTMVGTIQSCGTEVIVDARIVKFKDQRVTTESWEQIGSTGFYQCHYKSFLFLTTTNINDVVNKLMAWSKFDWAPQIYIFGNTTSEVVYGDFSGDACMYYPIDQDVIVGLHSVAVLSELGIPQIGSRIRAKAQKA